MSMSRFLDEADIGQMIGVTRERRNIVIQQLISQGMPKPDPVVGKYWGPAIVSFFDRRAGLVAQSQAATAPDGEENWK